MERWYAYLIVDNLVLKSRICNKTLVEIDILGHDNDTLDV